jgi:hypothetical protein
MVSEAANNGKVAAAEWLSVTAEGKPTQRLDFHDEVREQQIEFLREMIEVGALGILPEIAVEGEYNVMPADES